MYVIFFLAIGFEFLYAITAFNFTNALVQLSVSLRAVVRELLQQLSGSRHVSQISNHHKSLSLAIHCAAYKTEDFSVLFISKLLFFQIRDSQLNHILGQILYFYPIIIFSKLPEVIGEESFNKLKKHLNKQLKRYSQLGTILILRK